MGMSVTQTVGRTAYEEIQRRREYLAPLFAYLRAHHYIPGLVARDAGERGGMPVSSILLTQMKRGERVIPPWFVAECCRVIGRSTRAVMGEAWVKQFGRTGRGGAEDAPVGMPRTYRAKDALVEQEGQEGQEGDDHAA
jgi:hypothetical protein